MGRQFVTAGQGLLKVFFGQALSIASLVLSAAAVLFQLTALLYLSAVVSLAGFAMMLIGLAGASIAHPGYRSACGCVAVNVLVSLLSNLAFMASFYNILSLLGLVIGLCTAFLVCKTTAALLVEKGDGTRAERGALVWKTYTVCVVVSSVLQLVAGGFYGNLWALVFSGGALVLVAFAQCLYLWFLFSGQRALQQG